MELSATSRQLEAEIFSMRRKREALRGEIDHLISGSSESGGESAGGRRDKKPNLLSSSPKAPIFFITPTSRRIAQKADLTRLGQNLVPVGNLFWVIVEDSDRPSPFIDELMDRLGIPGVHLAATTPPEWKNKFPKGVQQRNAALNWLRENMAQQKRGVVYFGDDDK
uniref:Galactosylgalactosylxylosylprotein 3-beta-glucuronosyltransferase n=1 Tax=Globodera rostochiensis TaxID=31243 RepID=A0A914I2X9_GLORO